MLQPASRLMESIPQLAACLPARTHTVRCMLQSGWRG